jgi:hypothetical protein
MQDDSLGGSGILSPEKQRQLFFLGMGLYGAIFMINVVFYFAYDFSTPRLQIVRILAPLLTVMLTILDSIFLRSICRKQFPNNQELLAKWPIAIAEYPTWPYFAYVAASCGISIYLVSQH